MNLCKSIPISCIKLNLTGADKPAVIEELLDILVQSDLVPNRKTALKALLEREKQMSTGFDNGIAIPHGKCDTLTGIVACLGISQTGIEFDSIDGEASTIFIMTLSPENRKAYHLEFLGAVSGILSEDAYREAILAAETPEEIHRVFIQASAEE